MEKVVYVLLVSALLLGGYAAVAMVGVFIKTVDFASWSSVVGMCLVLVSVTSIFIATVLSSFADSKALVS